MRYLRLFLLLCCFINLFSHCAHAKASETKTSEAKKAAEEICGFVPDRVYSYTKEDQVTLALKVINYSIINDNYACLMPYLTEFPIEVQVYDRRYLNFVHKANRDQSYILYDNKIRNVVDWSTLKSYHWHANTPEKFIQYAQHVFYSFYGKNNKIEDTYLRWERELITDEIDKIGAMLSMGPGSVESIHLGFNGDEMKSCPHQKDNKLCILMITWASY